jgi:hypothetical protein
MATYKLDILDKEKKENLPYWLDPSQKQDKDTPARKAIREKYRAKWLAERKPKNRTE